jgi:hypothetical protein
MWTVLTLGPAIAQPKEEMIEPGAGAKSKVRAAPTVDKFSARLLEVKDNRLRFMVPERKLERTIHLDPTLAKALGRIAGRSFEVSAIERAMPSGIVGAVVLKDARGLYAIAESIRDGRPLFQPAERAGIGVEQLSGEGRTFVYETECVTVYNVPTAFVVGKERHVLRSHEIKEMGIGGARYVLSLQTSQLVVPKPCPATFEGARQRVDYALVRK